MKSFLVLGLVVLLGNFSYPSKGGACYHNYV